MTLPVSDSPRPDQRFFTGVTAAFILALVVFRILILLINPLGLHGDEAQYWAWSRDLDFGYFSKPPLIAWIIAAFTSVFGQETWAVRLASPVLHGLSAAIIFLSTRRLYEARAGFYAAALYLLMPGVTLSSALITTDAALLFCLSVSFYAWVRLCETPHWRWAALLGVAIGFGFLAKYAMIYILPGLIIAAIFEPKTRAALIHARGGLAAILAGLIILPNVIWNARNAFVTLSHTSDNANLDQGAQVNPVELAEFFFGQFAVFGPVSFALLLIGVGSLLRRAKGRKVLSMTGVLVILVITPLLVICVQALISRANANWAGAAYAFAPILLAGWATTAVNPRWIRWLKIALGFNLMIALIAPVIMINPAWVDQLGAANSVKRLRAWPETVTAITVRFENGGYDVIAADNRINFYNLLYYSIEDTAPLYQWRFEPAVSNHAELTQALPEGEMRAVMLISVHADYAKYFADDFAVISREPDIIIDLGGGLERRLLVYRASGYTAPRARARRDQ